LNNVLLTENIIKIDKEDKLNIMPKEIISFFQEKNLSYHTQRTYLGCFVKFLNLCEQNLELQYLSKEHFDFYKNSLLNRVQKGEIQLKTAQKNLIKVRVLSKYLFKNNYIDFIYRDSLIERPINRTEKKDYKIINAFLDDLTNQDYSEINTYRKNIMYFFNFLIGNTSDITTTVLLDENEIKKIKKSHLDLYHDFLGRRVALEVITVSRALKLLSCLNLFFKFCRRYNKHSIKYKIPEKFLKQGNRSNEYAPSDETLKLLDAILKYSRFPERDISIFLIILETGCRPIEVINMNKTDVFITESAVLLRSKKSGQRKLRLSKQVMSVIKRYIVLRNSINIDSEKLFLTVDERPITLGAICRMYTFANKKVYGKTRFTAKTYRHTYITNALENRNNFDQVSKACGHKHWISTQYYLEKSNERLKRNTLKHNPITFM
jgi:integrase